MRDQVPLKRPWVIYPIIQEFNKIIILMYKYKLHNFIQCTIHTMYTCMSGKFNNYFFSLYSTFYLLPICCNHFKINNFLF